MAINNVVITGRLTRDPEIRQTQSGVSVASFSVAVDRAYKSGEERQADFINCTAWRGTAEFLSKWFHKGDGIGVVGSIQIRKWETDAGETRYATEVVAQNISFLEGKKSGGDAVNASEGETYGTQDANFEELPDDGELPF